MLVMLLQIKVLKTKTEFTITETRVFRQISCKCWTLQCIGVWCLKDKTVRWSCCCIWEEEGQWMMDPWSLTGTRSSNPSTVERPYTADIPTENHAKDIFKWIQMVNFTLGDEIWQVNWSTWHKPQAWDNEKFWVPDRNRTQDLLNTHSYNIIHVIHRPGGPYWQKLRPRAQFFPICGPTKADK